MPVTVSSYATGAGYTSDASQQSTGGAAAPVAKEEKKEYWPLERCRKAYTDYLDSKQEEIAEQKNARRYYHGSQHTDEMIKALNKRKQPVVTFNHIAPKVNGVSGLIERLKQDPKAYPRTPRHAEGADLATAVIRAVLDIGNWDYKAPRVAIDAAVEGYSGIVIELGEPDDKGNKEIKFEPIDVDNFFYDPRSNRIDFSDARYMGEGKWLDVEQAQELYPDKADEIEATSGDNSTDLTSNPDRESKFFSMRGNRRLIRVVDCWYKHQGRWCWTQFTGAMILATGESYLFNEKKDKDGNLETICRYIMFSCNVDHDSDRYGFVRNMRSAQDELNARRSRALFTANSRRLIMTQGSVSDIERARAEWARPDGVIVTNAQTAADGVKADDASFDFAGQLKLMQDARDELNNYGPNQALIGDMSNQSGRAIQLLQQAGMAELGPYILGYKGWKVRTYRALFNAAQMHWTGEKWIRITDSQDLMQHVLVNGKETDPMTGYEQKVNAIGQLDVDIIMSEGQDTINAQQDVYETLSNIMPSIAPMLKPAEAAAAVGILIESSSLSEAAKKTWREATKQQPDPAQEQAKKITLEGEAAKVEETKSKVQLNYAKAQSEGMPTPGAPGKFELPPEYQMAKAAADIDKTQADAQHKRATAYKAQTDAELAPKWAVHDAQMDRANLAVDTHMQGAQFLQDAHNAEQDRKSRMQAHKRNGGEP